MVLVDQALDENGLKRIAVAIENYVLQLENNSLAFHPDHLPLRVVGDVILSRYQDNEAGQITLHSRESLVADTGAVVDVNLNELRFRSNIAIEGLEAWEEKNWLGRKIQISQVIFEEMIPKVRCLATQANPNSGKQDLPIFKTLAYAFNQQNQLLRLGW
jgi:uncharacterized protein YcbX